MHAWIGEPGLHDGEVRSVSTNRGGWCERARTGNAPSCDPILYSLDCGEKRHTPASLVCLDDDVVSRFEMYPEYTPSRRRIEQTARRSFRELSDAEGFESLCNLSGIISPEYVTFNSAYARPSPSGELILNNRLHRPHESIMAVACCILPNTLSPSGWVLPGTLDIALVEIQHSTMASRQQRTRVLGQGSSPADRHQSRWRIARPQELADDTYRLFGLLNRQQM